jgi:thymidylate kinase
MQEQPHRLADASSTLTEPLSPHALTDDVHEQEKTASPNGGAESVGSEGQSTADFLRQLFRLLNELGVRYCVIHSWEGLPEHLGSDLDLAVHPDDKALITSIIDELKRSKYVAYHWNNYITREHSVYFYWIDAEKVRTVAVDMMFEHRVAGLILASGEEIVASRVRHGDFWVPAPEIEFSYLLAKKAWKGKASCSQSLRLKHLVEFLGVEKAQGIAGRIFRHDLATRVVEACANGSIDQELGRLKGTSWQIPLYRRPLRTIRYWAGEFRRAIWRTTHPTGVLVSVLGPDGVGKSTVLESLGGEMMSPLRRLYLFHWRPQVVAKSRIKGPVTDPHGQTPRGSLISMAYLTAFFVDCWAGYLFVVEPGLVRCGFVQFDRYFHDVLVDPRRYRYGGPKWYAKLLSRLLPEPDLVILLDADADLILSRKTELTRDEIQRQRQAYGELRFLRAQKVYIRTDAGIQQTVTASAIAVAEFMKQRFENKMIEHWMGVA